MNMWIVNIWYDILRVIVQLLLLVVLFINIVFMQSRVEINIVASVLSIALIIQCVHSIKKAKKLTQDL